MGEPVVLVERTGNRVNIILNRPERKNSVTAELAEQLCDADGRLSAETIALKALRDAELIQRTENALEKEEP